MAVAGKVAADLPHLRRYAHAVTGSWSRGDGYTRSALQAVLADPQAVADASTPRVALYRAFHSLWSDSPEADTGIGRCRESLLLTSGEQFEPDEVAEIMELPIKVVHGLVRRARKEVAARAGRRVLILGETPDSDPGLRAMLARTPHHIVGTVTGAGDAVRLARSRKPDLLIAVSREDSRAILGVANAVLSRVGQRPVLFLTKSPASFVAIDLPAAAWLLALPCTEAQFRLSLDQLLLFGAPEMLTV